MTSPVPQSRWFCPNCGHSGISLLRQHWQTFPFPSGLVPLPTVRTDPKLGKNSDFNTLPSWIFINGTFRHFQIPEFRNAYYLLTSFLAAATFAPLSHTRPAKLQGGWPWYLGKGEGILLVCLLSTPSTHHSHHGPWTQTPGWLHLCEFPMKGPGEETKHRGYDNSSWRSWSICEERMENLCLKCEKNRIYGNVLAIWEGLDEGVHSPGPAHGPAVGEFVWNGQRTRDGEAGVQNLHQGGRLR